MATHLSPAVVAARRGSADPHAAPDRVERFGAALEAAGLRAAVLSHPRDLLYLAGAAQPANLLVVPGRPPTLFARRFAALARRQSHVADVVEAGSLAAIRQRLEDDGIRGGRIGMGLDALPAALYLKAVQQLPAYAIEDVAPLLAAQRARKSAVEVAALRVAVGLFDVVHATMAAHVRAGVAEHELAGEVSRALRRAGHDGIAFHRRWDAGLHAEGAIASGENLWCPSSQAITITGTGLGQGVPFGASRRVLWEGDLVNIDLGLVHDGYHADMARTYVVGRPSPDVHRLAAAVRAIQDAALDAIAPGVAAGAVYAAAAQAARDRDVLAFFQGHGDEHGPYIGHGIGLELDEPPVLGPGSTAVLEDGMVLAIEPKLIVPGVGAVNLEDDVVVRAGGCELLESVPREVFRVDDDGARPVRGAPGADRDWS
jgi:Xaa-Pro aminopeptidase